MPTDIQSFFRYLIPGSVLLLTIGPWIPPTLPNVVTKDLAPILGSLLLLSIPLGIPLFIIYFSIYHIPFEKHFMQIVEVHTLYEIPGRIYAWTSPLKNRDRVESTSSSIWYFIDSQTPASMNHWLRGIGAYLHSLGASLVALTVGYFIVHCGWFGFKSPSMEVVVVHTFAVLIFAVTIIVARIHYRGRYMRRLQRLIAENRKEIIKIDRREGNSHNNFA
ncbi:hypothetical protein [Leptospira kmetyi]|uniref:Uncharacterized protein n=1 Tax=Leptospira kmetyi TaxID=408139 RepID=A0ABX4N871_9LEPT|nr:hypothetical protein [Leptospira kmetyi]PJZ29116.1 hypothetical protein CH378_14625 [Leptospira kmetyi]PJZ39717.1 hypothetical protein CH370_19890 [Leptospira kmetyi]